MANVASTAKSLDRRDRSRPRSLLAGKLCAPDASITIDCTIRNISPTGAMVEVAAQQVVPKVLHLVHVKEGAAYDAEVVWRRGVRIGLVLKDRHDLRESTDRNLLALRAIWSQMALR